VHREPAVGGKPVHTLFDEWICEEQRGNMHCMKYPAPHSLRYRGRIFCDPWAAECLKRGTVHPVFAGSNGIV